MHATSLPRAAPTSASSCAGKASAITPTLPEPLRSRRTGGVFDSRYANHSGVTKIASSPLNRARSKRPVTVHTATPATLRASGRTSSGRATEPG